MNLFGFAVPVHVSLSPVFLTRADVCPGLFFCLQEKLFLEKKMENLLAIFFTVLITDFVAEFGDKTQLLLIGMTSKYKMRDIFLGTLFANVVLNAIAVFIGGALNEILNSFLWAVKFVAAAAFIYFAVTALKNDDDDEEEGTDSRIKFAPLAVFCTFFVAELGDKTQLTAVTFGANYGMSMVFVVFLACSIGLFAADIIGMLIGCFLKAKAPDGILKVLSFALFAGFGVFTVYQALGLLQARLSEKGSQAVVPVGPVMAAVVVAFAGLCLLQLWLNKRADKSSRA